MKRDDFPEIIAGERLQRQREISAIAGVANYIPAKRNKNGKPRRQKVTVTHKDPALIAAEREVAEYNAGYLGPAIRYQTVPRRPGWERRAEDRKQKARER